MFKLADPKLSKRIAAVSVFLLAFTGAIVYNLAQVSVAKSDYFRAAANVQQLDDFVIKANRGTIYDRNNKELATSKTVWDVILSPFDIEGNHNNYQARRKAIENANYKKALKEGLPAIAPADGTVYDEVEEISKALSEILGLDYDYVKSVCNRTDKGGKLRYTIVKKKIGKLEYDAINNFKVEKGIGGNCVYTIPNTQREYPNNELAASVIGFTNADNDGVYGIEAKYDDYLKGVDGRIVTAKDASGRAMPYDYEMKYDPQNGNSLVLTIDEVIQHYLEKNLDMAVTQHKANNRATGIVMNPKTGAILAMATSPGFDLNNRSELTPWYAQRAKMSEEEKLKELLLKNGMANGTKDDLPEADKKELDKIYGDEMEFQWKNKAVSELYYPGSVFKVVTAASALEEKTVSLNSSFYCSGVKDVLGTKFHCHVLGGHGQQQGLALALANSCNPAFIEIGQSLGINKFSNYLEAFGFTQKTGIDLPGEVDPIYMSKERMGEVELASSAFGQTNKITPIQMITAYSAVINGGYLVTPYVVDKIIDNEGNVIKKTEPETKRQVISAETSALMRQICESVVEKNGSANAAISGYRIGAKSGTTQKIDLFNEHPEYGMRYVGTFGAFVPADDPELIMLVCVDEPLGEQYYGSRVAAPVVSAVFKEALPYLEIYPQYTAEEMTAQDTTVPYLINKAELDARNELSAVGLNAKFIGDENGRVVKTIPSTGQPVPKGSSVLVYFDNRDTLKTKVPDVKNLNLTNVNYALTNAGLNIKISDGGFANEKSLATGQSIEPGKEVPNGTVVEVTFLTNSGGDY
jgi:stage V sporulation protein D (sporulation-specific penicillin-binding protein)